MNTMNKELEITSVSLMTGVECTAKIVPSDTKGIRFHLAGKTIEAIIDNVVSTEHCVVLGNQDIKVMLIEHFMAACAICNIDAVDVYLSHFELPILDGSAKGWAELFCSAGLSKPVTQKYSVTEPVSYINGKTHLVVLPSDKLSITYSVNFNHPDLKQKWVSLDLNNIQEITEARTFGYLAELEMLQKAGFAKGVSIENTVGLTQDGYTTELRSELEPAKHKILDLLGDFRLTGINPLSLNAEIIVKEAGHAVHAKVAKILKDKITEEK
jgi:UDP-3-O-[3-hydroxymyristoyl] N-acetylglucosamine deacetylase